VKAKKPDRYTILLVPEGGAGQVSEHQISRSSVRAAAVGAAAVCLVGIGGVGAAIFTMPAFVDHDRLLAENAALTARLTEVHEQLAELDPLVQRVQSYDEQLRALAARGALPGFGPLDPEAMAAREAWIAGVVGESSAADIDADEVFDDLRSINLDVLAQNLAALQMASEAMPSVWPVDHGTVTSGFGWRRNPFGRTRWKFHTGLDIGVDYGSPIVATGGGVVTFSDWDSGHGRTVEVDHGSGIVTRYCHASELLVLPGDEVLAGEVVALVGSSGMSTGPHLHYELQIDGEKVDPRLYLPTQEN
jgi:murein DD-endopeptidase MepM/ murein hydrolase activator NlpD